MIGATIIGALLASHSPLLPSRAAPAAPTAQSLSDRTPARYRRIVESYRRGERKEANEEIAKWTARELRAAMPSASGPSESSPAEAVEFSAFVRAAMLLHFEREMADRNVAQAMRNGEVDCAAGLHETAIERLVEVVEKQERGRAFIAGFAEMSSLRYRTMYCFPHARYWAELGLQAGRRTANLLVARGVIDALLAKEAERVWYIVRGLGTKGRQLSYEEAVDRSGRLREARRAFEAALAIDPSHAEAALRLGRLCFEARQLKPAEALLEIAARHGRPRLGYLGWLFRGGVAEESGDVQTAIKAYEAALRLLPNTRSAAVALAYVEAGRGDTVRARELIERTAAASLTRVTIDPLANYPIGDDDDLPALFATLFKDSAR